jgi:hypothetical protein
MKDVATLSPGDRVELRTVIGYHDGEVDTRDFNATYLGHTDQGYTIRIGAMTVERTYRWSDHNAWIADPRTDEAYVLPEVEDTLESIPPELE